MARRRNAGTGAGAPKRKAVPSLELTRGQRFWNWALARSEHVALLNAREVWAELKKPAGKRNLAPEDVSRTKRLLNRRRGELETRISNLQGFGAKEKEIRKLETEKALCEAFLREIETRTAG